MLTRLNAINIMLRAVGQSPITTAGLQHPHAILASNTLTDIETEVQASGWWFNEDVGVTLLANTDGEVIIPSNALNCDPSELNNYYSGTSGLVQRGNRMYDPRAQTFFINESVKCDIIYRLDFTEIPHAAASYIAYYAALEFHSDVIGDKAKMARLESKLGLLYVALSTQDMLNRNINARTSPGAARLLSGVRPASR